MLRPIPPKTHYIDRIWHEQFKKIGSMDTSELVDKMPELTVDAINRELCLHYNRAPKREKRLKKLHKQAKSKIARLQHLKLSLHKHEKNSFIRSFYLKRVRIELNFAKIWRLRSDKSLTIAEKSAQIHMAFSKIYPIPDLETRTLFINEFIEFFEYIKVHRLFSVENVEGYKSIVSHSFYGVESVQTNADFSRGINDYREHLKVKEELKLNEKRFNAVEVKEILLRLFRHLGIQKEAKVKIRDKYLFSVIPATRRIMVPKSTNIDLTRLQQIIAHEVMVHLYRAVLGKESVNTDNRRLKLLLVGSPANLQIEEGLASFFEQNLYYDSNKYDVMNLFNFYMRMITVHLALTHEPFEVYEKLDLLCNAQAVLMGQDAVFANKARDILLLRVYRGYTKPQKGCVNAKIAQYLWGNRQIWDFADNGGNIANLFIGRVHLNELKDVEALGFKLPEKYLGSTGYPRKGLMKLIELAIG